MPARATSAKRAGSGLGTSPLSSLSPGIVRVTLFTLIWTLANVAAHVALGLLLAYVLTRPGIRGRTLYRTILLLPWAIPGYISVLAWNGMLQPDGLINAILGTETDFTATPHGGPRIRHSGEHLAGNSVHDDGIERRAAGHLHRDV